MLDEKILKKIHNHQKYIVSNIDLKTFGYCKCGHDKNKKQIWMKRRFKTFSLFAFIEENYIFRITLFVDEYEKSKIRRKIVRASEFQSNITTQKAIGRCKYKILNLYSIREEGNRASVHLNIREDGKIGHSTFGISTIEEIRKNDRIYYKSLRGKEVREKIISKRRELGFIPLNFPFKNCHAHHVDKEHIIYIPAKLHYSIKHNLKTNEGMKEINTKAFEWLMRRLSDD